jgi:hypothetical protein
MGYMFYGALVLNQNLCRWRLSPFPYSKTDSIFADSGCTN